MTDELNHREKALEMIGEGPERLIRLAVFSVLAFSGIVLQGLVWWYSGQMAVEELGSAGIRVWTFAASLWILTVGLLVALLRQRLRDV